VTVSIALKRAKQFINQFIRLTLSVFATDVIKQTLECATSCFSIRACMYSSSYPISWSIMAYFKRSVLKMQKFSTCRG